MPKWVCQKCGTVVSYSKYDSPNSIKCPKCIDITKLPDLPKPEQVKESKVYEYDDTGKVMRSDKFEQDEPENDTVSEPETKAAEGEIKKITKVTNERKRKHFKRDGWEGTKDRGYESNGPGEVPEL